MSSIMVSPARASLPLALAALLACGDDLGPRVPADIVVTPEAPRLQAGGTLQLTATVVDASGRAMNGAVAFRSSDASIITVSGNGLLTSLGPLGSAIVIAASGDITAEVEAVVALPPSALVVNPGSLELDTGEQGSLSVAVTDENGEPVADAEVSFESSNAAIAPVEESSGVGVVNGLAVGSATITVTGGGRTTEVPVTVGRIPSFIDLTPTSLVLSPGGSQQVTARLLDRTGEEIEVLHPFAWSSSDAAVATVSPAGMVAATGPEGTAIVTVTIQGVTASLGVFVGTPPAGALLARLPLVNADGVDVLPDGRYFVAGFGSFAGGALPDLTFSVQIPVRGDGNDVVVNSGVTRAYVAGARPEGFEEGVGVVDLTTNSLIDFIPVGLGRPSAAGLSEDGSRLLVGTEDGFEWIDVASKASLGGSAVGLVSKITRHPLNPLLYATVHGTGVLELDPSSGEIVRRFPGAAFAHALTPDGTRLYTVGFGNAIGVWNLETGEQEESLAATGSDIAVSPDGRFLYVLLGFHDVVSRLFILERRSGVLARTVTLDGTARRIVMSGDGTAIITNLGGEDGWVDFVR